jgi:ABC-type multidrug transport system ATPase subunit
VSGRVPAGAFAAIMGPTACGKSTLLAAMRTGGAGAYEGEVAVMLGGRRVAAAGGGGGGELARRIGYVPQEDVVDRSATIRELLTFSARARVPHLTAAAAAVLVDATLADLGLAGAADTVVGGSANAAANISGGQLKRVNIALELVALARPAALLLDEPTAGLDASIAAELAATLGKLSAQGITVVMVVQQPRPEIFARLTHLLLLQRGAVVYEGAPGGAARHFAALGYEQPEDASDADFAIDVLNGLVPRTRSGGGGGKPASLAAAWAEAFSVANPLGEAAVSAADAGAVASEAAAAPRAFAAGPRAFLALASLHAARALTARLRDTRALAVYASLHVVMAASLSVGFTVFIQGTYRNTLDPPVLTPVFCPAVLRQYCEGRNQLDLGFAQLLFFMSSALGTAAGLAAVPLFGGSLGVLRREAASGLSTAAAAVGRMAADLLLIAWNAAIFAGVWLLFAHSGHHWAWLFGVLLPTAFAASGVGYVAAACTRPVNAAVITIIAVTAMCVFSGVEPTLASVAPLPVLNWPWYLSFATWTAESTYITWVAYLREGGAPAAVAARVADGAAFFGYSLEGQARAVGALVGIGLAWRAVAVAVLVRRAAPSAGWVVKEREGSGGGEGGGVVVQRG